MKTAALILLLWSALFLQPVSAQNAKPENGNITVVAQTIENDLEAALKALAEQRSAIAGEKIPLAKATNKLAADLREQRRLADLAKVTREAAADKVAKHEKELKVWRDEKVYLESLLLDFRKTYETVNSLPRIEANRETLNQNSFESRAALVSETLQRITTLEPVSTTGGSAISGEGVLIQGEFAEAGPLSWFISEDNSLSGLVTTGDQLQPKVVSVGNSAETIKELSTGANTEVIFDPTLGSALAMEETKDSLIDHVKKGGFWIFPILLLGMIALLAAIAKWLQLSSIREVRPATIQRVIEEVNRDEFDSARNHAENMKHPSRKILEQGIEACASKQGVSRDDLEEQLFERFLEAQPPLQRWLPLIAIASATAPLLGLLGTVTGMIETFRMINIFGTGDAKSLASGISEALVTTEFGLIVAIPALILHALLSRKVSAIKANMEMASLAFLNGLKLKDTA